MKKQRPKHVSHKTNAKKAEIFPHFRFYIKSGHPTLIVGEDKAKTEYLFRKVSHEKGVARKQGYETVFPNPKPNDPEPMYIEKRKRHDKKKFFHKRLPWVYKKRR